MLLGNILLYKIDSSLLLLGCTYKQTNAFNDLTWLLPNTLTDLHRAGCGGKDHGGREPVLHDGVEPIPVCRCTTTAAAASAAPAFPQCLPRPETSPRLSQNPHQAKWPRWTDFLNFVRFFTWLLSQVLLVLICSLFSSCVASCFVSVFLFFLFVVFPSSCFAFIPTLAVLIGTWLALSKSWIISSHFTVTSKS